MLNKTIYNRLNEIGNMKVKGTTISFFPDYIRDKHGKDKYEQWLNSLPPNSKSIYQGRILSSAWYPLKDGLIVPLKSICEQFHGGDVKGAFEIGKYSADWGLSGIYKIFVMMGSPESLAKKATTVFPSYYEGITSNVVVAEPGRAVMRIEAFPDADQYIENRIMGYMNRAVEICGGKNVKSRMTSQISKGAKFTEYEITWN